MKKISILLVDDHDILLDGIEAILQDDLSLDVKGKAHNIAEAESLFLAIRPDILITDISLGNESGLDLTTSLLNRYPGTKIIVLSMHQEVQHITSLMRAGALGYLLKTVKKEELYLAIQRVCEGEEYIQQSLRQAYSRAVKQLDTANATHQLSSREIQILKLIVEGNTSSNISSLLFLSEYTVDTHRKNIGRKTGAKTPLSLMNFARTHGIISD